MKKQNWKSQTNKQKTDKLWKLFLCPKCGRLCYHKRKRQTNNTPGKKNASLFEPWKNGGLLLNGSIHKLLMDFNLFFLKKFTNLPKIFVGCFWANLKFWKRGQTLENLFISKMLLKKSKVLEVIQMLNTQHLILL